MTGAALNVKRLIKAITQSIEIQANPVLAVGNARKVTQGNGWFLTHPWQIYRG
jgi:hypothetical protein